MTDQLTIAHHRITDAVEQLTTGIDWQTMPDVAARFHTYSPNNIWLILAQRPDATRVAGYHTWRNLDRWVRKREHGIAVLAPIVGDAPTTAWDMLAAPIADAGFSLERGDGANGNTNHTTRTRLSPQRHRQRPSRQDPEELVAELGVHPRPEAPLKQCSSPSTMSGCNVHPLMIVWRPCPE